MKLVLGVGVAIIKDKKILLGYHIARKYEDPCWAMPGGHVEEDESVYSAAKREAMEEANLELKEVIPLTFYDDFTSDYRVISFQVVCTSYESSPEVTEPEKIQEWKWFSKNEIPENLTKNGRRVIESGLLDRYLT